LFTNASVAHAASGTILSSSKYAWSNVGGWVNFAPSNSIITVTDTAITGYAWSANDGWINFAPTNGGVKNTNDGTLSGFAWDQTAGWVNFAGVTIDTTNKFHGQATGANGYVINFDCTSCLVETNWSRTITTSSSPGSISPVYIPPSQSVGNTLPTAEPPTGQLPPAPSVLTTNTPNKPSPVSGGATYRSGSVPSPISQIITTNPVKKTPLATHATSTTAPTPIRSFWRSVALPAAGGVSLLVILAMVWWILL
jgi:hypothetical protein